MEEICILHLTDIHCDFEKLDKINEIVKNRNLKIDFILASGDLTNMKPSDNVNENLVNENEKEVTKVLEALQKIHPKIYYVPGNHDALSYFNHTEKVKIDDIINSHKKHIRISENLVLSSLGGSVPAFYGNGAQRWAGYPYIKAEDIKGDLEELFSKNQENEPSENDSILLMTHVGPSGSTTIDQEEGADKHIYAGSDILKEFLQKQQNRIFLNIHGHTHFSQGINRIGNTYVFNPGSVNFRNFGVITIKKADSRWSLKNLEICFI